MLLRLRSLQARQELHQFLVSRLGLLGWFRVADPEPLQLDPHLHDPEHGRRVLLGHRERPRRVKAGHRVGHCVRSGLSGLNRAAARLHRGPGVLVPQPADPDRDVTFPGQLCRLDAGGLA